MSQPQLDNRFNSKIQKSTRTLALSTGAWVLATAFLTFGPRFLWPGQHGLTILAAAIDIVAGLGMVFANMRFLNNLDELQRKIHLDAMGITLGVLVIAGVPYSVLDIYKIAPFKASIAHLMILISLTFLAAVVIGSRRYR